MELRLAPEEEEGEARTLGLAIGAPLEGAVRAVRGGEAILYRIPAERVDDLPRRLDAYRYRTLGDFTASDARRLELDFAPEQGEPVVVTAERGEAGWASAPERLSPAKVSRIVSELARLRAEAIEAESLGEREAAALGLAPPRAKLRTFGDEGSEPLGEVWLGNFDPERGILARVPDSPIVYRLDYGLAEHLPVTLEALRNRFLAEEEEAAVPGGAEAPSEPLPGEEESP